MRNKVFGPSCTAWFLCNKFHFVVCCRKALGCGSRKRSRSRGWGCNGISFGHGPSNAGRRRGGHVYEIVRRSHRWNSTERRLTLAGAILAVSTWCLFSIAISVWLCSSVKAFYFHVNRSIGIVQKIDFEIRPDLWCTTPKTSRKVVLDNLSVCLSVCPSVWPSVCLAVAFPASSHRRKV